MTEDPGLRKAIETVQKLLNLASKNTNEAEATAAMAKAQELMEAYNLDLSTVERASGVDGKREEAKNAGGLYQYQRDLWFWVAQLNFCVYWTDREFFDKPVKRHGFSYTKRGFKFVHKVVGRTVNTTATRVMAEYLEQIIERLTRERLNGDGAQFFTRWATSYREGIAARVCEKIYNRREAMLSKEKAKVEAERRRAQEAGMVNASTATALTLLNVVERENDANADFIHGEGYSARRRARHAKQAEASRLAQEEYTQWAAANPEEACKKEEERERAAAKAERRARRAGASGGKQRDWGAYRAGYEKGRDVSLDPQAAHSKGGGLLK